MALISELAAGNHRFALEVGSAWRSHTRQAMRKLILITGGAGFTTFVKRNWERECAVVGNISV